MKDIVLGWIVMAMGFAGAAFIAYQYGIWSAIGAAFMTAAGGYAAARGVFQKKKFREAYALGYQHGSLDARDHHRSYPPETPTADLGAPTPPEPMPPQRYGHDELKAAPSPRDW